MHDTTLPAPDHHPPAWIWSDPDGAGRNVFVLFRQDIVLAGLVVAARITLFADARWRLQVNGHIVAYGPGRFVAAHPAYDEIDLASWLRPGRNRLLVEAWSPGTSTFQTMRSSSGGFVAWGSIRTDGTAHDLATPGSWLCHHAVAWDHLAPAYSFAQGPVEILDQARLPTDAVGTWQTPMRRRNPPWGELVPRQIPPLGTACDRPVGVSLLAALAAGERRVSCRVRRPAQVNGKCRFPYALSIRSPRRQSVRLGLFWGPHWLDGRELAMVRQALGGNRLDAVVELEPGVHILYGEPEILAETWAQYVAWPADADLEVGPLLHGRPASDAGMPSQTGRVPATPADLDRMAPAWVGRAHRLGAIPARDMAWDRCGEIVQRDVAATWPICMPHPGAHTGWVMVLDMGGEFLGHVRAVIDAPPGTVVDIATDERRRDDGFLALYASHHLVNGADRVILAGGQQDIELFHPRGGRWIQVTIRPPAGATGEIVVHDIAVRRHQVPIVQRGSFSCSDPVFDWTWTAGAQTLAACIEDAFIDCPWRERGTYVGDAVVEAAALAAVDGDPSIARRTLELLAQAQREDGLLQACAPSWHEAAAPDFSLLWIILLHQLWAADGDLGPSRRHWGCLQRILASRAWRPDRDGLWAAVPGMFIDWGVFPEDRAGEANACLNILRLAALESAVALAQALGDDAAATAYQYERTCVLAAVRRRLWLATEQRFAGRCDDRVPAAGEALHANTLALAFGVADADHIGPLMEHLTRALAVNAERAIGGHGPGFLDLYFLHYAGAAAYRCGRADLVEAMVRSHWGAMRERGAWTLWESLRRGASGLGSLCHAWSAAPLAWFHRHILGVRYRQAGRPDDLIIAPDSHLVWARGVVPHPLGAVEVAWRRHDGVLLMGVRAPPGVTFEIVPGPAFADLVIERLASPEALLRQIPVGREIHV